MMQKKKVVIIDMQPITPAVGGGRQRLLGLYHALGDNLDAVYVGSYDWPGESLRDLQLTPGLREIVVPLSDEHHAAARESSESVDGRVVIDCLFSTQAHLSPAYLDVASAHMADADIVVFSHPWAYPPLAAKLQPHQLVVYDSQNVESVLRTDLHAELGARVDPVLRTVVNDEYTLCCRADLVLACSHDDRETFARLYGLPLAKIRVVPNGIFAFARHRPDADAVAAARAALGVAERNICIFVGSNYGPNNNAARFIASELALSLPEVRFAIMGGCGAALSNLPLPANVTVTGVLDEATKGQWMDSADVALNPLAQGSGTSIKMFDFMAAWVPVLTTAPGARGIVSAGAPTYRLATLRQTLPALRELLRDTEGRLAMADAARKLVEDMYAWERISPRLGWIFESFLRAHRAGRPTFSVVIPSYERPDYLGRLFAKLDAQKERDFEVIVIDQSALPWADAAAPRSFPLTYVHSPVKGAVKARNLGGDIATGSMIAFTDDDCEPFEDWLSAARPLIADSTLAGIEGCVESDHLDDPDWRPVSNVAFVGLGFMTANLMAKSEAFHALDGFDLRFDEPHFREDTDFGWRLQALGNVPYRKDVRVFHPAHRRNIERESTSARNKFFEKDALLFKKHPERYKDLFLAEGHWRSTPGFVDYFMLGMEKYGVAPEGWLLDYIDVGATDSLS
jgi:glycosyltransferase involved in cell wall biosynthesis